MIQKMFSFFSRFLSRRNGGTEHATSLQEANTFADQIRIDAMRDMPSSADLLSEAEAEASRLGRKHRRRHTYVLRQASFWLVAIAFAYYVITFGWHLLPGIDSYQHVELQNQTRKPSQPAVSLKGIPGFGHVWPTPYRFRITSPFGQRIHKGRKQWHHAIDIAAPKGSPVIAVGDGVVASVGKNRLAGNFIRINHGDGWVTFYAHLSKVLVKSGTHLKAGTEIGLIGKTGDADGYHLHFAVKNKGRAIDPIQILPDIKKG